MTQLALFKPPLASEFRTHCAVARLLDYTADPRWIWTHFPSGEKRNELTAARLKAMGLKRGFFDFLLISPDGTHHWLELKRGKAHLTEEQAAFSLAMMARGVPCEVARSYEQAVGILTGWGILGRRMR